MPYVTYLKEVVRNEISKVNDQESVFDHMIFLRDWSSRIVIVSRKHTCVPSTSRPPFPRTSSPKMLLNMMRNRRLVPLEFPANWTRRYLHPPHICIHSLMSPIRLFQRRKKPHVSWLSPSPAFIIKILVLISNISLHPASNHPPTCSSHTSATLTFTIPTQPRPSAPNNSLALLSLALTNKLLHPPHPSIS